MKNTENVRTASGVSEARYRAISAAFDRSAPHYDLDERRNPVALWTRQASLRVLFRSFRPGQTVLEAGCGTGTEALALASAGINIVATDASPGMISQLQAKAQTLGQTAAVGSITGLVMPASQLDQLCARYGMGSFDGAYSSFGPLNGEVSLETVARALALNVKRGRPVVLSLLNRFCAWETMWYLLHADVSKAFRRWSGRAEATVRGEWQEIRVPVSYWSPAEVERALKPYFHVTEAMSLPWILPPQYLSGLFVRRRQLFNLLARVERATAPVLPFRSIGDHYLLRLVRTRSPVPQDRSTIAHSLPKR